MWFYYSCIVQCFTETLVDALEIPIINIINKPGKVHKLICIT